jgi:stage V sporulation protein R
MNKIITPLFEDEQDWTDPLIEKTYQVIEDIALNDFRMDVYPNQIEIINSEQMLEAYCSVGMPNYYRHWSYGKAFESHKKQYSEGYTNLAYEIVLNSNPCLAYLQENNTMTMQALVIAHASFGHNAVFKGNEFFQTWTQAGNIMNYLKFARNYIEKCEVKYGEAEVESLIDSAHALQYHGINTYKRKSVSRKQLVEAEDDSFPNLHPNFERLIEKPVIIAKPTDHMVKPGPNKENILYFIEKNSPSLPDWKREIIRIVRTIAQYFYPQMITKVLNEGYASYTHHRIMEKLYDRGHITGGSWLNFIQSHTNVIAQSGISYQPFRGWNPYALGFAIFKDIERICENPTQEDRYYFPNLIGENTIDATTEAMKNYNDSSFISQYLSPKVMRDFKMFTLHDPSIVSKNYNVAAVSDEMGYNIIRQTLASQYERNYSIPSLEVVGANLHDDRKLIISYKPFRERTLNEDSKLQVLAHLKNLWGYDVILETAQ